MEMSQDGGMNTDFCIGNFFGSFAASSSAIVLRVLGIVLLGNTPLLVYPQQRHGAISIVFGLDVLRHVQICISTSNEVPEPAAYNVTKFLKSPSLMLLFHSA